MDSFDEAVEFVAGSPAGGLAQAAIGREGEAVGRGELEAGSDAVGDVLGSFQIVAFDIDHADCDVFGAGDVGEQFEFGAFAAGHFEMDFIHMQIEERREHGSIATKADGVAFEVAEAEVGGEAASADSRFDRAIEDIDEAPGILQVCVTAHGGFIESDLATARLDQRLEFVADNGQEGLGQGVAIGVLRIGQETATEGVGAGDAGFEGGRRMGVGTIGMIAGGEAAMGEALEAVKIGDGAQAAGGAEFADHSMPATLVVGGRTESARRRGFEIDAVDEAIKGEVEIEPGLFAICDDIEPGVELIVEGDEHCIVDKFLTVSGAELVEMSGSELQPAGKRIAADDSGAQRMRLHRCEEINKGLGGMTSARIGSIYWTSLRISFRLLPGSRWEGSEPMGDANVTTEIDDHGHLPGDTDTGEADTLFRAGRYTFRFPGQVLIMGIVNVTPDSFSDGGRYVDTERAVDHALALVGEGASIVDVGGESTRPGADPVDEREERRRVLPVVERLVGRVAVPISIDTVKPEVARAALAAGATLVNDVAANRQEEAMWRVVAEHGAGYICVHMQGTPRTMQEAPRYGNVVEDVAGFFEERMRRMTGCGVALEQVVLDVGIGFGKKLEHNLQLLRALGGFRRLGRPLLVGVSRKSFLGQLFGVRVEDRLPGSLACAGWAVLAGVQMLRVHDVAETVQAVRMTELLQARRHDKRA
jgi:dihydropteroate synthase